MLSVGYSCSLQTRIPTSTILTSPVFDGVFQRRRRKTGLVVSLRHDVDAISRLVIRVVSSAVVEPRPTDRSS